MQILRRLAVLVAGIMVATVLGAGAPTPNRYASPSEGDELGAAANDYYLGRIRVTKGFTVEKIGIRLVNYSYPVTGHFVIYKGGASEPAVTVPFSHDFVQAAYTRDAYSGLISYRLEAGYDYRIGFVPDPDSGIDFQYIGMALPSPDTNPIDGIETLGSWRSSDGADLDDFGVAVMLDFAEPAPIPTLTEWAMILLGLGLAGGAVMILRRRRLKASFA